MRGNEQLGDWTDRFWMIVGWLAILFPLIYMSSIARGVHANVQVGFGLLASGLQGAIWAAIWFVRRQMAAPRRRMLFPVGTTLSLAGFVSVGAATNNLGWAGLVYLLIAAVVIWTTSVWQPISRRSLVSRSTGSAVR